MKTTWPLFFALFWAAASYAEEAEDKIYEIFVRTDANWTSIEIRDDAVWVNAPPGRNVNVTSKYGLKSYTLTPKKMQLRSKGRRGEINLNLFVKSKNDVLGLTICKGSPSSFTEVQSKESKQKNDVKEQDFCDKAALVLNLN